jgi:hypothetical protein
MPKKRTNGIREIAHRAAEWPERAADDYLIDRNIRHSSQDRRF